jgi:hypothetical protein
MGGKIMDSQTENKNQDQNQDQSQEKYTKTNASDQSSQQAGKELIDELTHLGQKFVEVVEVAWNSEQRKKIEEDLRTGLVSVASTLEDGFKRVSSSKEAQEAVNAAEDVAAKVRSSKMAIELSEALADGLRSLSDQMDKLSNELKQKSASSSSSTGAKPTGTKASGANKESQDIPIAREDQEQKQE